MKYLKLLPFAVVLLLASCTGCNENKGREKPDVSNIKAEAHILRFDQDMKEGAAQANFAEWQSGMRAKYGDFYDFYLRQFIIGPRPAGDTADINEDAIKRFYADQYITTIQTSIDKNYKDTKQLQGELTSLFKNITYYFPKFHTPQVVTFNSAYSAGVSAYGAEQFAIGLDMFLGENNPDYDSAGIYVYLRHKMTPAYIPRYTAEALYDANFAPMVGEQTLLESMVERGKQMYFISYVLPDAPDYMIYGYTGAQAEWCKQNEKEIWKFFNDKDLLYKSNAMDKARYLGEGPTSAGMPKEAPGNIGNYIGLQIVRQFMANEGKNIPLADLVLKYDAKTILSKAKYRPGK